ncbi:hypothetical protein [Spirillospora sp. CA-294931]|uniref:hypothetical protein n=1 Tax=Spirillospora sp. CA-294931 TaxID=3240042 RepID=UPI003D8A6E29
MRFTLPAALAAVLILLGGLGAPAHADDNVSQIANGLINSRVYVTSGAGSALSPLDKARTSEALAGAEDADIRAVIVKNGLTLPAVRRMLHDVADRVGKGKTYVAVTADGNRMAAFSKEFSEKETNQLIARSTPGAAPADRLVGFAGLAEKKADDKAQSNMVAGFVTLAVIILLAAVAFGAFLVSGKRRRARQAREMAELKKGVEEDVTLLGEDIARLDLDVMDPALDPDTRSDYERAMNSYDDAKLATNKAARPEDMENVTKALEDGRFYMTATRSRLAGEPVPKRRAPCFFNPNHGPSSQDVTWAPPGGVARSVPACPEDAQRVLDGHDPDSRMVPYGDGRRPYWDAGPAYAPYAGGYYATYGGMDLVSGMMIGTMLGSMMSVGHGGGGDIGGGWDFGGGDFGGGGGDFGGF